MVVQYIVVSVATVSIIPTRFLNDPVNVYIWPWNYFFLQKNREMFEPFIEDDVPFEDYCKTMDDDGTWAGNMELQAASLVTRSNICIHRVIIIIMFLLFICYVRIILMVVHTCRVCHRVGIYATLKMQEPA